MAKLELDVIEQLATRHLGAAADATLHDPDNKAFAARLSGYQERVRQYLSNYLPGTDESPEALHTAMRYAALGNGKHIRPLLTYACGEALSIDPDQLDAFAGAIELIHAFSLVHDDLPAMDDDALRRGQPTTHIAFGETMAILAGDALQIAAFHLLATDEFLSRQPPLQMQTVRILSQAAGSLGMTGGQAMDMTAEGRQPSAAELEAMYLKKTGQLIWASIAMPCALREHSDPFATRQLLRFAENIGLAFQIRDDLLEFLSTEAETGKSTQSDADRRKATYPGLFGVAEARRRAEELYSEAIGALDALAPCAEPLRWLANFIIQRKA